RRRMLSPLLILPLLLGTRAHGPVSRAASRNVTTFFQLAQEDAWENVNLTSMSCEDQRNRTWITLQLTNSSLTAFPVCLPEALEILDLSNNLLAEVNGTELANLPELRVLSLRHNRLRWLRWGSETLGSLLKLDLSFNRLSAVPPCQGRALPNLRWLSLAGNPLIEIRPLAFACYPQLQLLNLSATLLGREDGRAIGDSAFAISADPSEAHSRPGNSIRVLDLSGTFLEKVRPEWARDLANLRSLHLTNMPRLRSLDKDFLKSLPALRELQCQNSPSLGSVATEMFDSAPHLSYLSFENCNLSSFNPWNTNSSGGIAIGLHGNPLLCDCQLSWLLAKPEEVVLQKVQETFCTSQEDSGKAPTSFSLLELYNKCRSASNVTLPDSNTALPGDEALSESTSDPPSSASVTSFPVFFQELFAQSPARSSTSAAGTEELQRGLRTTDAAVSREGPFGQSPGDYSTGGTGVPLTTGSPAHPFATRAREGAPQTSPPQLNSSTRSSARPAPTTASPHYIDDYDYEEQPKEPAVQAAPAACDYNPCRHLQRPCGELQNVSRCSCPGTTREDEIPEPPRLREVTEITDSSAQIRWCAPYSVVHSYELTLRARDEEDGQFVTDNIYPTARQFTLYNLLPFTTYHICVTASNKAGSSRTTGQEIPGNSCTSFKTKPSYKYVFAGLSAASGLFLITTVILAVCLCKACKKPQSEQYGTHLVSYKNPA
ncbi:LRRN4 protein, partial [Regulus satrapa]|nr:LRRN4 protein [Regulus satrapa]